MDLEKSIAGGGYITTMKTVAPEYYQRIPIYPDLVNTINTTEPAEKLTKFVDVSSIFIITQFYCNITQKFS